MYNVEHKTKDGSGSAIMSAPENMKLSRNFILSELANKQGDKTKPLYLFTEQSERFNSLIQDFRDLYRYPIDPTSGYRQFEYNKRVGGDPNSLHLRACAMDFIDLKKYSEYFIIGTWFYVLNEEGIIGAVNIYKNDGYYRYHLEAFSDVYLNYISNRIRVYTNKTHYNILREFYLPLGIEVVYAGK